MPADTNGPAAAAVGPLPPAGPTLAGAASPGAAPSKLTPRSGTAPSGAVPSGAAPSGRFEEPIVRWYGANARDLPWRRPGTSAWSVLVSEFMLQQTPVARVRPAHAAWLDRWPTPADLAAATAADALRQWGRLGYPRRAIRLHATARQLADRHDGIVPASVDALRALPGVGAYTAAAVASFAFGQRHAVLDTNVRRVLARLVGGQPYPAAATSAAELSLAESLLPPGGPRAARWSVAIMELGALVCTAARPACGACPVAARCQWAAGGRPHGQAPRAAPRYDGSDRQCRGAILAALRAADAPVTAGRLRAAWHDEGQQARALAALVADGLVTPAADGMFCLPGDGASAGTPR